MMSFDICMSGYARADDIQEAKQRFHVKAIFAFLIFIAGGFIFFTAILLVYHTFLIMTNQTTWEHSRRRQISYMRIYPRVVFPFDYGIINNVKMILCHKGKVRDWTLRHPQLLKTRDGFNYFDNEYYNC
jgi:palmitoyltransferase